MSNPNVDERRSDIRQREALTPGEGKLIRYTVREKQADGTFVNAPNFTAYTEWEFYCFERLGDGGVSQATRQAAAIFYVVAASIAVGVVPYATVTVSEANTALIADKVGLRAHELWAKVSGVWSRLSYGDLPFVN